MLPPYFRRLSLPRTLRRQFTLALTALVFLMTLGSLIAVYALRESVDTTRQLAGDRLSRMEAAQYLVEQTLLIERRARELTLAASIEELRAEYGDILEHLEPIDRLVEQLGQAEEDPPILALRDSEQLFRNTAHVVARLREANLQQSASDRTLATQENTRRAQAQLQSQATAMVEAARQLSDHLTEQYRQAIEGLAVTTERNQWRVLGLLVGGVILAWMVSHYFLGKRIVARLQQVSHYLRRSEQAPTELPVQGSDEIGEMARAVEQFLMDRRQLAEAHVALQAERARQEELIKELAEAQNQLLQSEKLASIGQLAAGVAHEINNPVGFVNSNLGALQRYLDNLLKLIESYEASEAEISAPTREALDELKKTIDLAYVKEDSLALLSESIEGLQRVKRIVQDLKDFSHVDESDVQMANLEQGLDSTINVAWNEIKYKADVIKEYGGVPDILCMPSQLNQVFLNLLVNAAHAIPNHGRITVRTGYDERNVWVEVEDNGSGIKPEHLGRIFDPFFTTKPVGQGTGLGLSLSYGIIQKHDGHIEVKSQLGTGTTFRIVLPRRALKGDAAKPEGPSAMLARAQ